MRDILRLIEVVCLNGIAHVGTQRLPAIPLGDDTLGEALCAEATVPLLRDLEDEFSHLLQVLGRGRPGNPSALSRAVCQANGEP